MRKMWGLVVAGAVLAGAVGCSATTTTPTAGPTATTPRATASTSAPETVLVSVVDGDTIETNLGTVRIIGIDAPERGVCGYDEASALVSSLVRPGDALVLTLPDGENEADRHGRLLRYVDTAQGVDVGAALLTAGLGIARYDSADGYPGHPREAAYHSAQTARLAADGSVTTVACQTAAEQAQALAEQQAAQDAANAAAPQPVVDEWWRQYSSCTKLKKNPNGHPTGPFARDNPAEAAIYDWFAHGTGNNGDGEGDGLACE